MIRLFSLSLSIVALAGLSYAAGQHTGSASGKAAGVLDGCQQVLDVAISPDFEPTCVLVQNELAVRLTHPVTGEEQTRNLATGELVQ